MRTLLPFFYMIFVLTCGFQAIVLALARQFDELFWTSLLVSAGFIYGIWEIISERKADTSKQNPTKR